MSLVVDQLTMMTMVLNQGSYTGWFNPAAAIWVKSKKPTGFIFLAMCKLLLSETRIESTRSTFLMATPSPTKLLVRWYTMNLKPMINWCRYQYKCTGTNCTFWIQLRSHLHIYKRAFIPILCFRAKKEPSVWPCWLHIAHLFLRGLVRFRGWIWPLP